MRKCCFIIPYFGKFPNYFPLFLKSCSFNKKFNWLLITNNNKNYDYPENFRVVRMSFDDLRILIQSKFDFEISLNSPYKLCDYKPAYGYLFEEYINEYSFWGHCDVDVLMGNLEKFLTDELLDSYDKIFCLGHMVLYKNSFEDNRVFKSVYRNSLLYKKVFTSDKICWFDEEWKDEYNINQIFKDQSKKVYEKDLSLNFSIYKSYFLKVTYDKNNENADKHGYVTENYKDCICLWDHGDIKRFYINNNKLVCEEYAYIHLQKRRMFFRSSVIKYNRIRIAPNYFFSFRIKEINISNFYTIRKRYFNLQYWDININPKIKRFLEKI